MLKREVWLKFLDSAVTYSLYLLIFTLPISKAAVEIFSSVVIFLYFLKWMMGRTWRLENKTVVISLVFLLFFMSLSLVNSGVYMAKSFHLLMLRWVKNILVFLIASQVFVDRGRLKRGVSALLFSAAILVIDGIFQKSVGADFFWLRPLVDVGRGLMGVTASFEHYNSFGSFLSVSMIFAFSLWLKTDFKNYLKWLLTVGIILSGLCFYWTFSRGSWVSFLSGVFLMLLISRRFKILFLFFAILLTGMLFAPEAKDRFLFIFQTGGDQGRFALWKISIQMIKENPILGKGLGTFMKILPGYAPQLGLQYAHNSYLQILVETGIFSLLSFLSFIIILLSGALKKFSRDRNNFLLLGFICSFFCYLFNSFFDNQLYSLQLSSFFWILAAFLNSSIEKES